MSIEEQIKRLEDAIRIAIEHRDWLGSHEWHDHRNENEELGEHLDEAIEQHDRNIETYRNILATLRAR